MDCSIRVWDLSPIMRSQGAKKGIVGQITQQLLSLPSTVISTSINGEAHTKGVNWVVWAPDDVLYSASDDQSTRAWRLNRGKNKGRTVALDSLLYSFASLSGHTNNVNAVEIGSDNIILTAGSD